LTFIVEYVDLCCDQEIVMQLRMNRGEWFGFL
jgi:hypothetical protein